MQPANQPLSRSLPSLATSPLDSSQRSFSVMHLFVAVEWLSALTSMPRGTDSKSRRPRYRQRAVSR